MNKTNKVDLGIDYNRNPRGRPVGSRNRRTEEIFRRLAERGDKHPADILSEFASDISRPAELRATCANMLLPYMVSKKGAVPAARFVDDQIQVPDFQSIEQAQSFLAMLSQRAGAGELELQSALDVSTLVKNWILSKQASIELDLKVANSAATVGDQTIRITGGLPPLPGTNITMPMINGHTIDGSALIAPADDPAVPTSDDPSTPQPSAPTPVTESIAPQSPDAVPPAEPDTPAP